MQTEQIKIAYFFGIGGIGMSALARYFNSLGTAVFGYDKTPTSLTATLKSEGIEVEYDEGPEFLPENLWSVSKEEVLFIYTPAVPKDHKGYTEVLSKGYRVYKRAEVLGLITRGHFTVAVAGTHGKTTTSSLIAHMLTRAGKNCTAFLGGISANYNTNYIQAYDPAQAVVVVEADEYDRSFLQLQPDISIITSTDADHLDIYGAHDSLKESFAQFAALTDAEGFLLLKEGLGLEGKLQLDPASYSITGDADYIAGNIRVRDGSYTFDFIQHGETWADMETGIPGRHNVENAVAACAVGLRMGLNEQEIREGIRSFKGAKRRFEYIIKKPKQVFIDDYAHHPTELRAFISSVKELYPQQHITGIFQPHLFSRTRDFALGFAESLNLLDECILLPIYPAREAPIAGVSAEMIADMMQGKVQLMQMKKVLTYVSEQKPRILLTMGAGDIDQLIEPIKEVLL